MGIVMLYSLRGGGGREGWDGSGMGMLAKEGPFLFKTQPTLGLWRGLFALLSSLISSFAEGPK